MKNNKLLVILGSIFVLFALAYIYHINSATREGGLFGKGKFDPSTATYTGQSHATSRAQLQAAENSDSVAGSSFAADLAGGKGGHYMDMSGKKESPYLDADGVPGLAPGRPSDATKPGGEATYARGDESGDNIPIDRDGYSVIQGADQQAAHDRNKMFDEDGLPMPGSNTGIEDTYDQGTDFNPDAGL